MRQFLFALVLGAALTAAHGHTALMRSEPKANAALPAAPNELRLWFSEFFKVGLSTIEVRDAAGRQVDQRDLRADAQEPKLVHLSLAKKIPAGTYHVTWTAVAEDMHVGKGSFIFRIEPAAP